MKNFYLPLVVIINRFPSSVYAGPECTSVRSIVLFSLSFVLPNTFIQCLALFHVQSGSVGILSGYNLATIWSQTCMMFMMFFSHVVNGNWQFVNGNL